MRAGSLWQDEATSVTFAHLSWKQFLTTMRYGEDNMGVFYLLLRGWLHLGESDFVLRWLPVFSGAATISQSTTSPTNSLAARMERYEVEGNRHSGS